MKADDGNGKTDEIPAGPQQFIIQVNAEGRIEIVSAPNDFIQCLGMLHWALDKLWEMYRVQQQPKGQPKIQMPTPGWPPRGRN